MNDSAPIRLVYVTCKSLPEARSIGKIVVQERLAACINILGPVESIYQWEGKLTEESEIAFLCKTSEIQLEKLIDRIKELHPYACPSILAWTVDKGNEAFLGWIEKSTEK